MNFYYNKEAVGDVLLIDFLKTGTEEVTTDTHSDITTIRDEKDEVVGYNLFNASKYVSIEGNGKVKADQHFIDQLNKVFAEKGVQQHFTLDPLPDFIIGYVQEKKEHPDADKLSICLVDIGEDKPLQIVCGAPNIEQGQKVVVARVGAVMPSGMVIKDAELRGVASSGMICSARELALPNAPTKKGILVLDESEMIGKEFKVSKNH